MRSITYANPNGHTITFGLPPAPYYITALKGIDAPSLDLQTQKAPYQDGTTLIDQLFQSRTIAVEGAIAVPVSNPAIAPLRREILSVCNPKDGPGTLTLTTDWGTKSIRAVPSSVVFPNRVPTVPFQVFQLMFYAADPFFLDPSDTVINAYYTSSGFSFPLAFPDLGITMGSVGGIGGKSVTIDNVGDVDTPVVIRFDGPATNPKMTLLNTGEYIQLNVTLTAGQYVEVSTGFGSKSVAYYDGATLSNGIVYLDILSSFFSLVPGSNDIQFYDAEANTGSYASIAYRNRFIGV